MDSDTKIYYLSREDGIPFYIGKTIRPLKERERHHKTKFSGNVQIHLIKEIPTSEWKYWEKFYIKQYKDLGYILENKNEGGSGPTFQTKKSKQKISDKLKNQPKPKGFGKNLSEKNKGQKRSKEFSLLQSTIHKGIKRTKKFKSHMSKVMKEKGWKPTLSQIESVRKINSTPILQLKDGVVIKEWNSQKECADYYGVKKNTINNNLRGYSSHFRGYQFRYK